jgi:hypothetical protein
MKASIAQLSLPDELAMANVMWQKNMERRDAKHDIHCVWSNHVCKCFVATSTSRTVLNQLQNQEFPMLGGVLIYGEKIIYFFNE